MTRHRNWNNFKYFNVNQYLHGLTHWEKRCSFLGYSDCQAHNHIGGMLLSFSILLSIFRFTKRTRKRIIRHQPWKIKPNCYVKVYIAVYEMKRNKNPFLKLRKLVAFFLTLGILLFGGTLYWTSDDATINSTLHSYFCSSNETIRIVETYADVFNAFQMEILKYFSLCSNLGSFLKVFAMLLLLCGDVEQNPGPEHIDDTLTPQLLQILKWTDQNGEEQQINLYKSLASDWRKIADLIGLDIYETRTIEENHHESDVRIRKVFETWILDSDKFKKYQCTWKGLVRLLNDAHHSTLAVKVGEAFGPLQNLGNAEFKTVLLKYIWWEDERGQHQILKIYDELTDVWESIAHHVGLHRSKIQNIKFKCKYFQRNCLISVFEIWRRKNEKYTHYQITWNGLRRLMETIQNPRVKEASRRLKCALLAERSIFKIINEDEMSHSEDETQSFEEDEQSHINYIQLPPTLESDEDRTLTPSKIKIFEKDPMIIGKLDKDTDDMIIKFRGIKRKFRKYLIELGPSAISPLKSTLTELRNNVPLREKPTLRFDRDLEGATNFYQILDIIYNYCSFFSFNILEDIFDELGYEEGKEILERHKKDLANYCKYHIYYFPSSGYGIRNEGRLKVAVKLASRFEDCRFAHLLTLQENICQVLNLKGSQLLIDGVVTGCICINFHLPKHLKYKVFPLSSDQLDNLRTIKCHNASICHISCENFQYDLTRETVFQRPDGCIILVGKPGSGKTTAVNNIFDLDTIKRTSPAIITKFTVKEDISRQDKTIRVIKIPGLESDLDCLDTKSEVNKALENAPYIVLYCLPITESYLTNQHSDIVNNVDRTIIRNLQRAIDQEVWKKCVLLITFSDTIDPQCNKLEMFHSIGISFHCELSKVYSGIRSVKSILEYEERERMSEEMDEIVTIPVTRTRDSQTYVAREILTEYYNWTDIVFTEMARKIPEKFRTPFIKVKYDITLEQIEKLTEEERSNRTYWMAGGGVGGALIGLSLAVTFGPAGMIPAAIGAAVGGAIGSGAGYAMSMSRLYLLIRNVKRSRA